MAYHFSRLQKLWGASLAGLALLPSSLPVLAQAPVLTSFSPVRNALAAPRGANVALTFSQPLAGASAGNVRVFSQQRGGQLVRGGNATVSGNTLTVDPATDFKPGETVMVTVPNTVLGASGQAAAKHVYQFTTAVGGTGRGTFVAPATGAAVSVGTNPSSVALGDVDNDGDLDLLTCSTGTVSVRFNDGSGVFSGTQDIITGTLPFSLAVGDADNDGDLDLLVSDPNSSGLGKVSVLLNDGGGTFSVAQNISTGRSPASVALGDLDGDGDLDFVTANYNANTASVRINNGGGSFSGTQEVSVGANPNGVAVGDVDGDGDLDLLAANTNAFGANAGVGTVSIRLNDGTGTFSGLQNVSVGDYPLSVVVGDVDADGDLDLLTANNVVGNVGSASVRLNDGTGTFGGTQEVSVGASPWSIVLGDVDADGDLDLLTPSNSILTTTVSVRLNDGSGAFGGTQDVSITTYSFSVALGDIDGDSDLDLLVTNTGDNTVSVRLNGGTGPVGTAPDAAPAAFTLAPNPARGAVRLTGAPAHQSLTLLDATGRWVAHLQADAAGAASLGSTTLKPGLYLVRAADGRTARLVVE